MLAGPAFGTAAFCVLRPQSKERAGTVWLRCRMRTHALELRTLRVSCGQVSFRVQVGPRYLSLLPEDFDLFDGMQCLAQRLHFHLLAWENKTSPAFCKTLRTLLRAIVGHRAHSQHRP
eukprot:1880930-Pleurochrysis_carterae.AAC.1